MTISRTFNKRGLVVGLHTGGPEPAAEAATWSVHMVTIAADNVVLRAELARRVEEFGRRRKASA